jgi:hypothetical protein
VKGNSPRQRTLREMQRLVAVAAAMGACAKGQSQASGESRDDAASKEQSQASDESGDGATSKGETQATGESRDEPVSKQDAAFTAKEPPPKSRGYAVVDPMPSPARCLGLARTVKATTRWDGPILELVLAAPAMPGAQYETKRKIQVTKGASLKKQIVTVDKVVLRLEIEAGTRQVQVSIPATCPHGPETLLAIVRGAGPLERGGAVAVILTDEE